MKLYHSPMSPYGRKVRAVAIELALTDRIEEVMQAPRDNSGGYHDKNPLGRIPALETGDGEVLFDSPVICEYLIHLAGDTSLLPAPGPARWAVLKRQAMADGILDAAVPLRWERVRENPPPSPEWLERYTAMILRPLDALDRQAKRGGLPDAADLGTLALACALGYLDFRFGDLRWRAERPALAAWEAGFATRPAIAQTVPVQV